MERLTRRHVETRSRAFNAARPGRPGYFTPGQPIRVWIGACLLAVLVPVVGHGGQGTSFKLPMNNRVKNGIIADVNTWWVDGFGYRPVRIRLSVRKANRDRTITVRLMPNSYTDSYEPMRIETKIEIPQGEKVVTKTIYIPQDNYCNWIRLDFFEGGKKLKDLSMERGQNINQNYYNGGEKPCVLIVDSHAPPLSEDRQGVIKSLRSASRKSNEIQPEYPNIETISFFALNHADYEDDDEQTALGSYRDVDSLSIVQEAPNFQFIPPGDLPTSYVGLGSIDLLIISVDDLRILHENEELRFQAIDAFVRNGGNLITFGQDGLGDIVSELFDHRQAWTASDPNVYFRSPDRMRIYDDESGGNRSSQNRKLMELLRSFPEFYVARHGYGRIVASHAEDPFALPPAYWRFISQSIGSDRLSWNDRHGISLNSNNSDFWDFLIPGYGATPVISFLSVITFFVICIGPVNFYLLRRIKRFNLLPFTVVLAALGTTSVMMTYAFLSDGVERRVRLRSFTNLDQRRDGSFTAATHCRHAYLAAVAPKDGLVFPERTLAYPIVAQYRHNARRRLRVDSHKQERAYHYGYIGSRSTTQFLTTDVQGTENGLLVSANTPGKLQAINRLGIPLQHAWVIDAQGVVYYGSACESGGTLQLATMDRKEARKLLNQILVDNRPEPPDGLDKANSTGFGMYSGYFNRPVYAESALLNADMSSCTEDLLRGTPQVYVVVADVAPPFIEQGLSAIQEAGFHVIRGSWRP